MSSGSSVSGSEKIKQFKVKNLLGKGAFGDVYKVVRRATGETYAMKKINIASMDQREIADTLNEIRFLASVRHPNIIGFLEAFLIERSLEMCIVMEYADGGDLAGKVEKHQRAKRYMDEKTIWAYILQILEGLQVLHDRKILHRDLKTANCFLTTDGHLKIGDLNVSKLAKHGLVKTQIGTPYYMSPEIWHNRPYDHKSDMWAVGCILYELAALRPPFRGTDIEDLARRVQAGYYPRIPSQYSKDLEETIRLLLSQDPRKRPSAVACLELPGVARNHAKLRHLMDETLKSQLSMQPEMDLLATIQVPRNIKRLTHQLPAACYPDSRPTSPSSWPATDPRRVEKLHHSEPRRDHRDAAAKPPLEKKLSDPLPLAKAGGGIAAIREGARADLRQPPATPLDRDRRAMRPASDARSVASHASRDSRAPGAARHLARPPMRSVASAASIHQRPPAYGRSPAAARPAARAGAGGAASATPGSHRHLPVVSRAAAHRDSRAAPRGYDSRASRASDLPVGLAVGLDRGRPGRPAPRSSHAAAAARGVGSIPGVPSSHAAGPASHRSAASQGYGRRSSAWADKGGRPSQAPPSTRNRSSYGTPGWWG